MRVLVEGGSREPTGPGDALRKQAGVCCGAAGIESAESNDTCMCLHMGVGYGGVCGSRDVLLLCCTSKQVLGCIPGVGASGVGLQGVEHAADAM